MYLCSGSKFLQTLRFIREDYDQFAFDIGGCRFPYKLHLSP